MILLRMIAFRPAAVIQPQAAVGDPPVKKPDPPAMPVGSDAEARYETRYKTRSSLPVRRQKSDAAAPHGIAVSSRPASRRYPPRRPMTAEQPASPEDSPCRLI